MWRTSVARKTAGSPARSPRTWPMPSGRASVRAGWPRKPPATIVITSPGRTDKEHGTGPRLTLAGDPGELTMFGAGRQGAAGVEISGEEPLVARLRTASLGI